MSRRLAFDLGAGFAGLREPRVAARFAVSVALTLVALGVISMAGGWLAARVLELVDRRVDVEVAQQIVVPLLRQRFALDASFVIVAVVAAPVIEAALLAAGADAAVARGWSPARIVAVSGAVFGALHAGNGLLAVLPATGVFVVLTLAYLHWRRHSFELGFLAAVLPHALFNAGIVALKWALR